MAIPAFKKWLKASRGRFPKKGVPGVESRWFPIGTLKHEGKSLAVADLWGLAREDGVNVRLPPGRYAVHAKGMAFGPHRRVSRVRVAARPQKGQELSRGRKLGNVPIDSWGVAIADLDRWFKGLDEKTIVSFVEGVFGKYVDGCEIVKWSIADRPTQLALAFTGLGDGMYPVFALRSGGKTLGLEVEFLPPGYVE
jgi:hypothetical protein